jgi:hypothetical protein
MQSVVDSLKKDISHYQEKIGYCDDNIRKLEGSLIAANAERDRHLRYVAELREALAVLSPEAGPARVAA